MTNTATHSASGFHLILGYGVTGKALAAFFTKKHWPFAVFDDILPESATQNLKLNRATLVEGHLVINNQQVLPQNVSGLFPSPGVPPQHPLILWCEQNGIKPLSELELASGLLEDKKFIGVTGTNGKSTVVKLIHSLLSDAGLSAGLFGNYGEPLITAATQPLQDFYVIEQSSFQLEQIQKFRNHISVWMNLTDDHYERYKNIQEYGAAKERVFLNSQTNDVFIYNHDDMHVERAARRAHCKILPFSITHQAQEGAFVTKTEMVIRLAGQEWRYDLDSANLRGLHNQENMLAALLAAHVAAKDHPQASTSFANTLKNFKGLPHRVEKIHEAHGVTYYDDSKGTNVGAVVMSLAGFDGSVILIMGGRDKGGDYTPLKGLVHGKVKHLILLGESRSVIAKALDGDAPTTQVEDMRAAVQLAKSLATTGDTILLSPACSSFDQYKNYKERGLDFQKWVKEA